MFQFAVFFLIAIYSKTKRVWIITTFEIEVASLVGISYIVIQLEKKH